MYKKLLAFKRRGYPGMPVGILLKMKLAIAIIIIASLHVSASGYSQPVTLAEKNAPLEKIFQSIRKQTGYVFFYDYSWLSDTHPVSMNVKSIPLEKALDLCFVDQPLTYAVVGKTIVISPKDKKADLFQDSVITLRGRVTDPNGNPLPGVTVKVKDQNKGISTDADGNFILRPAPGNIVLLVSYIGYNPKEIAVTNVNSAVMIRLEENTTQLDQVMVVGYGTQKKSSVTGSIVQVSSKELSTAPTSNLSAMLQGRLPGLVTRQSSGQPGSDGASLLVRGYSTLGNSSPLIIVDGVERDFPSLNPDEIESVTVLKDAAAAVYGVRAANGVIMVTSKRGNNNQKPTINFNSSLALSTNTNFPKFLNGQDYAYWYNRAQELDGIGENARRFTADEMDRIKNGDPQGVFGNTDWFDLLFKSSAPIYTNNLSISGGTDRYKYFVSIGSYSQDGIIDRTSYKRYNVRANLDATITKRLSAAVNLALRDDNTKQPGLSAGIGNSYASIFSQAMLSYPFLQPYNAAGMPVGSQNPGNGNQNAIAARDLSGEQNTRSSKFQGSIALKYDVPGVEGLSLKMNTAFDKGYSMKKSYLLPYLLSVYNPASRAFTETYARHALTGDATLNQWFADSWQTTLQPSVNYDRSFGKHSVSGLFLYEYMRNDNSSLSGGRRGYPITDIMDLNFGEEVIDDLVKGGHGMFHRAGYVTRLNYDFAGKYLFEFTGRVDGSPMLPSQTRWGIFPGASLGWRISEEDFFKNNVSFVDNLKLRASASKLGNDRIADYQYLTTMSLGPDPVVMIGDKLSRPLSPGSIPNLDIKWETTMVYNGGIEGSLWNGLLGVEADVFYKVTKDILQGQSNLMPSSLGGYFPAYVNSGIVDNRGFELTLQHRNHIGQLNYQVRGNVSWARNKVIQTTEDPNVPDYLRKTGKPIGMKYGFVADGLFQSQEEIDNSALFGPTRVGEVKLKDLNGDGRITWDQDWTMIGRGDLPEVMFGFNVSADYKGFDFNMFFQGAAVSDVALSGLYSSSGIYDNTFYTMPFYQDGNAPNYLVEGAWTPENPNAKYPRLSTTPAQSGGKFSSFWIRKGDYLRLKSAQIGYTLPATVTNRINIQRARIHVSGSNLFTVSALGFLDPEMPSVNQGYYPQQRLFEFGLNITL
ncbi:TonB-dependent receptor [Chitinophaga sp. MM2321]|uniref:TonB-dependent receptor n=1 Tax=Chitinophaga sp. MM2321 TaxID=3137178 RepID=UPI0032D573E9